MDLEEVVNYKSLKLALQLQCRIQRSRFQTSNMSCLVVFSQYQEEKLHILLLFFVYFFKRHGCSVYLTVCVSQASPVKPPYRHLFREQHEECPFCDGACLYSSRYQAKWGIIKGRNFPGNFPKPYTEILYKSLCVMRRGEEQALDEANLSLVWTVENHRRDLRERGGG